MQKLPLAMGAVLALLAACAPASPDLDLETWPPQDGGEARDAKDSGIRILSDAALPGQGDVSKGRGGAGGTDTRDVTTPDATTTADTSDDGFARADAALVIDAAGDLGARGDARDSDASVATGDAPSDAPKDMRGTKADGPYADGGHAADVGGNDGTGGGNDADGVDDAADGEVDAAVVLQTCADVRACVRTAGQTEAACLRGASVAARSSAEPLLACEAGACSIPCRTAYALEDCNACLLHACPTALVGCARQSGCGDGAIAMGREECDDGNADDGDACTNACTRARCGDGVVHRDEEACDDGNDDAFDRCGRCVPPAAHLLVTEVVTRPAGAEFIEVMNPTPFSIALSDYLLSDSHLYYEVATGGFTTASGSDFAARFPDGAVLEPGGYAVVALGNASGGSQSFFATYGKTPDFELRPTANQATDDPAVPNMAAVGGSSIGASASLTDGGEPVVLFSYPGGDLVSDVDYLFYGTPSASNAMVDKTGVVVGASAYLPDTPASAQHVVAAPGETGSIHRCVFAESRETTAQGNGIAGHDETSEDVTAAFGLATSAAERTPGGPPSTTVCGP